MVRVHSGECHLQGNTEGARWGALSFYRSFYPASAARLVLNLEDLRLATELDTDVREDRHQDVAEGL